MKQIKPRTGTQRYYLECLEQYTLTLCAGPAGTGKTYLAMTAAIHALRDKKVERIVVTRPAVEAGERLGFLPGTLDEKIAPYVQPVFGALHDIWPEMKVETLISTGLLQVAPLAYMRGTTFNDSFVILDEAQNTTVAQMKMFLTRLGSNTTMVVAGDHMQNDLPRHIESGLTHALRVLDKIQDVGFCYFKVGDVQRHPLVKAIVKAYDKDASKE